MGVDGDAGDVEGVAEDDVGGLAPDAGQGRPARRACRGSTPSMLLDERPAEPDQRCRLVAVEPVGDQLLELGPVRRGVVGRRPVAGEQLGVTSLTRTSVVCADRMVATASSYGVVKSSSQCASVCVSASSRNMRPTRRARPSAGSPAATRRASRAAAAREGRRLGVLTRARVRAPTDNLPASRPVARPRMVRVPPALRRMRTSRGGQGHGSVSASRRAAPGTARRPAVRDHRQR